MILHQGCASYNRFSCTNRIICAKGIQVDLSASKPDQLDKKGRPPAQGRNQDRWCHKDMAMILRLMADFATRKLDARSKKKMAKDCLPPADQITKVESWQ